MSESRPPCFGIPEECMPRDENRIIQPQERCRLCDHLKECLRTAIASSGGIDKVRSVQNRDPEESEEPGGIVGAVLRWSARKRAAQRGDTS